MRCVTWLWILEFYGTAGVVQNPGTIHLIQLPDPCFWSRGSRAHFRLGLWTFLRVFWLKVSKMLNRRRLMTADILRELALDSDSDIEPSDADESAEFLSKELDSESKWCWRRNHWCTKYKYWSTNFNGKCLFTTICPFTRWPPCCYQGNHNLVCFSKKSNVYVIRVSHFKMIC